jgi:hypothetical protein
MFPHISTEALVCALVLSEEGNLSRTADRLHTSTSNVGRKVKALQADWGVQLFHRSLTGFELTEEGRASVQGSRVARLPCSWVYRASVRRWHRRSSCRLILTAIRSLIGERSKLSAR